MLLLRLRININKLECKSNIMSIFLSVFSSININKLECKYLYLR